MTTATLNNQVQELIAILPAVWDGETINRIVKKYPDALEMAKALAEEIDEKVNNSSPDCYLEQFPTYQAMLDLNWNGKARMIVTDAAIAIRDEQKVNSAKVESVVPESDNLILTQETITSSDWNELQKLAVAFGVKRGKKAQIVAQLEKQMALDICNGQYCPLPEIEAQAEVESILESEKIKSNLQVLQSEYVALQDEQVALRSAIKSEKDFAKVAEIEKRLGVICLDLRSILTEINKLKSQYGVAEIKENNKKIKSQKKSEKVSTKKAIPDWDAADDAIVTKILELQKERKERSIYILRLVEKYSVAIVADKCGLSRSKIQREVKSRRIYNQSQVIAKAIDEGKISWAFLHDKVITKGSIEEMEKCV